MKWVKVPANEYDALEAAVNTDRFVSVSSDVLIAAHKLVGATDQLWRDGKLEEGED